MLSEAELCERLLQVEHMALQSLIDPPTAEHITALQTLADTALSEASFRKCTGTLSPATRRVCMRIGTRISQLTTVLTRQHTELNSLRSAVTNEVNRIVAGERRSPRAREGERIDHPLNAVHMRDWFLHHLGNPFPTRSEKLDILAETNRSSFPVARLEYNQAMLWFINSRRRSGWTAFLRQHANGDKGLLMDIALTLEAEQGGTHQQRGWSAGGTPRMPLNTTLSQLKPKASHKALDQLRSDWAAIIEWVTVGIKDRIGEWVDKVIESVPRPKDEEDV